jgi:hypothetical protein
MRGFGGRDHNIVDHISPIDQFVDHHGRTDDHHGRRDDDVDGNDNNHRTDYDDDHERSRSGGADG